MRKLLSKIVATFLSIIVLLSSMSFTVDKHFCGETLVDVSYFGKANDCGMKMNMSSESPKMKKKCCKNETEFLEFDSYDKENVLTLSPKELQFLVFHVHSYLTMYKDAEVEKEYYKDFSPPDLVVDIQVLHESFLI